MKDKIQLIAVGIAAAVISWMFWHFAGQDAFFILSMTTSVALFVDNRRLRKAIKRTPLRQ